MKKACYTCQYSISKNGNWFCLRVVNVNKQGELELSNHMHTEEFRSPCEFYHDQIKPY